MSDWYKPYISHWGKEAPSQFPKALAETIPIEAGCTRLLDIGCGSGIIGIYALIEKNAKSVTFTDIAPLWIDIARRNVDIKMQEGLIQPGQAKFLDAGDMTAIHYDEVARHDLVAFNPPQLPYKYVNKETREKIDADPVERIFRHGGQLGLEIANGFFAWYARLRTPKPDAVILLSSFLGRQNIERAISDAGLKQTRPPTETEATLRPMFLEYADRLSLSPLEMEDRSIRKADGVWYKMLLTYRVADQ